MNFEKLDHFLTNIDVFGVPNCDCAVTFRHEPVFRKIVGYTNVEKTKPACEEDIYFLYSGSKITLATAVMQLVEQGKLKLDDPASRFFPEFDTLPVKDGDKLIPCKTKATIEHLFSMQGGLKYDFDNPSMWALLKENPAASTQEALHAYLKEPLEFEPGTHFLYSMCLDVLGGIVEMVSGERYSDYVKNHIAAPLGWKVCEFHVTPEIEPYMPQQYQFDLSAMTVAKEFCMKPMPNTNFGIFGENYDSAGAGLITRVSDYMTLIDALSNDGIAMNGAQILTRRSIDDMRTDRLITKEKIAEHAINMFDYGYGYGLGVRTLVDDRISESPIGEFGWDGNAGAFMLCDVENKISITYLMSVPGIIPVKQGIHNRLRDLTYEALKGEIRHG